MLKDGIAAARIAAYAAYVVIAAAIAAQPATVSSGAMRVNAVDAAGGVISEVSILPLTGPTANEELIVEARGYTPKVLTRGEAAAGPVVLDRGAVLRVEVQLPQQYGKLTLLPIDVSLPPGFSHNIAARWWTRDASAGTAEWRSLPPGTYQLIARAATASSEAAAPIGIAEVVLAAGDARVLRPDAPRLESSFPPAAQPLRLTSSDPHAFDDAAAVMHLDGGKRTPLQGRTDKEGAAIVVNAPCSGAIVIETPGRMGAVRRDNCNPEVAIALVPRASITAAVAGGNARSAAGRLHFGACQNASAPADVPFVSDDGRLDVNVPAGCGELTLHLDTFTPVRPPFTALAPSEKRDLGSILLERSAAVAFRVRSARTADVESGVHVTAVRERELDHAATPADLGRAGIASAATDRAGWVRLTGLPAQERLVFLLRPQGRSQPQVTEPYSIEAGEETILRDVALEEASRIFVDVTVPKSVADVVELHSVTLHPVDDNHWPRHLPLQAVIAGNRAAIDDVPPGTWEVRATGRLVNGFALKLAAEKIDVSPGSERYVVLTVADALYRGRVTRAGAPVRGTLNLRPVSAGEPAVAKLDAEGEFRVLLASPGEYVATVQDAEKHMVKLRDRVRFSDASTRVEITLPLGTIAGRVVDSAGVPVAGVFVNAREQAQDGGGESSARAAADGSFVVKSTYAGKWELVAESTRQRSEPEVVFASDGAVEGVTLVVDDTRVVNIEVVDSTGTLMRFASVDAEFAVAGSAQPQTFGMRTGRDGRVTLRLTDAQRAAPANLVVRDLPGGVLSCELRRLNADQTVRVPALTGELRLIAPRWIATVARNWLVSASGCAVPFFAHVERERSGGEAMVFARLRTGTWRYVQTRAPEELRLVLTGRGQLLPAIATFTVDPLKTTRVNVNP